jgi:hypothetical protein
MCGTTSQFGMVSKQYLSSSKFTDWLIAIFFGLPWVDITAEVWKLIRHLWHGLADEGMYEVLEYESVLELMDKQGKQARFQKREKVRYQQNNIIAYQDHAWGDGEILIDYRCSPGIVVDRYRPGQRTFLLISLREPKRRGEVDEFNMEWKMQDGFKRSRELWETEIRHRTKLVSMKIIFPKSRPPQKTWMIEQLRRRKYRLDPNVKNRLPDGRWLVTWKCDRPKLNERYQLHWEW